VINNLTDQLPTSFDGLLGDAVLRPSDATHTAAYNAVAISTVDGATTGSPVSGAQKTSCFLMEWVTGSFIRGSSDREVR